MPEVEHGYDCLPPLKNIESYRLVVGVALQGSVTCFTQWLDSFMFYTFPMIAPGAVWAAALANFIYVGNAMAQTPILLIFNKAIRATLNNLLISRIRKIHNMKPTTIEVLKS
ncbi:unnamed protein product [Enterobius vermicularis]|uniref:7TM_GPCR_Srx domain-containing protein n=1 Tax=Enterobius vermicularis TaxID=51028 RepID=A0A158Q9I7_ENTVE|nr:unnamed protein product [Enterobius vermicularis]